jgi:hypothetical protein
VSLAERNIEIAIRVAGAWELEPAIQPRTPDAEMLPKRPLLLR